MSPNAMRVLRALGLEEKLRAMAFQPRAWTARVWDTGEYLSELTFGAEAEKRYGAPYLLHASRRPARGSVLGRAARSSIAYEKKLVGFDRRTAPASTCASPTAATPPPTPWSAPTACTRWCAKSCSGLRNPSSPDGSPIAPYFRPRCCKASMVDTCTKWWGPDRHIVIYPVNARRERGLLRHQRAGPDWDVESWSARGEMAR